MNVVENRTLKGLGAAQFASGVRDERELFSLVENGDLSSRVLEILLPDNRPLEYEGSLWDYKRKLPNVSGKFLPHSDAPDDWECAELVKDVVSFHNSYGGYIVVGVEEHSDNPLVGCQNVQSFAFNVEKLNEKLKSYTKHDIKCLFKTIRRESDEGNDLSLGLLLIPRRPSGAPVVKMVRGSPEKKNKALFAKGDIFARLDDKCLKAERDKRVLPFVCSNRLLDLSKRNALDLTENNLPPPDPNLFRFVGRQEYLTNLWSWIAEQNSPLKVLTALGGTGKTAIAYEFCQQLVHNKPFWLDKIIWLSAKKQLFSAIQGKKQPASRVDFYDVPSFFIALLKELGVTDQELIDLYDDTEELISLSVKYLSEFPSLIVLDDIDTLTLDGQSELFANVQTLAGRAFAGGSRVLVTSRLEFGGASQRIEVKGFPQKEFREFVKTLSEQTGIQINDQMSEQLRKASLGSPVFAASVFRLVSLGTPFHKAVKDWKGRAGEDVRRFAFERELSQLTDAESRTLFALVVLGETTQAELSQILEVDQQQLLEHLTKIRDFHLFATTDSLVSAAKLTVPSPITLMSDVIAERVNDPTRIKKECARARSRSPKISDQVSSIIGQVRSLWKEKEFEDALLVAQAGARENPKSGDLPCLVGRCQLMVRPMRPKEADKNFRKAFENGCIRTELPLFWIEAKRLIQDWVGISEIASKLPKSDIRGAAAFVVSLAEANLGMQASARSDPTKALERFRNSMNNAQDAIRDGRADDSLAELREIARESAKRYVSITDHHAPSSGDRLRVFDAMYDAFRCHISEGHILLLGTVALKDWSRDVFSRENQTDRALEILAARLDRLAEVIEHVEDQDFGRTKLANTLSEYRLNMLEDLRHFEKR